MFFDFRDDAFLLVEGCDGNFGLLDIVENTPAPLHRVKVPLRLRHGTTRSGNEVVEILATIPGLKGRRSKNGWFRSYPLTSFEQRPSLLFFHAGRDLGKQYIAFKKAGEAFHFPSWPGFFDANETVSPTAGTEQTILCKVVSNHDLSIRGFTSAICSMGNAGHSALFWWVTASGPTCPIFSRSCR